MFDGHFWSAKLGLMSGRSGYAHSPGAPTHTSVAQFWPLAGGAGGLPPRGAGQPAVPPLSLSPQDKHQFDLVESLLVEATSTPSGFDAAAGLGDGHPASLPPNPHGFARMMSMDAQDDEDDEDDDVAAATGGTNGWPTRPPRSTTWPIEPSLTRALSATNRPYPAALIRAEPGAQGVPGVLGVGVVDAASLMPASAGGFFDPNCNAFVRTMPPRSTTWPMEPSLTRAPSATNRMHPAALVRLDPGAQGVPGVPGARGVGVVDTASLMMPQSGGGYFDPNALGVRTMPPRSTTWPMEPFLTRAPSATNRMYPAALVRLDPGAQGVPGARGVGVVDTASLMPRSAGGYFDLPAFVRTMSLEPSDDDAAGAVAADCQPYHQQDPSAAAAPSVRAYPGAEGVAVARGFAPVHHPAAHVKAEVEIESHPAELTHGADTHGLRNLTANEQNEVRPIGIGGKQPPQSAKLEEVQPDGIRGRFRDSRAMNEPMEDPVNWASSGALSPGSKQDSIDSDLETALLAVLVKDPNGTLQLTGNQERRLELLNKVSPPPPCLHPASTLPHITVGSLHRLTIFKSFFDCDGSILIISLPEVHLGRKGGGFG